jgi:hypothetical protein
LLIRNARLFLHPAEATPDGTQAHAKKQKGSGDGNDNRKVDGLLAVLAKRPAKVTATRMRAVLRHMAEAMIVAHRIATITL